MRKLWLSTKKQYLDFWANNTKECGHVNIILITGDADPSKSAVIDTACTKTKENFQLIDDRKSSLRK